MKVRLRALKGLVTFCLVSYTSKTILRFKITLKLRDVKCIQNKSRFRDIRSVCLSLIIEEYANTIKLLNTHQNSVDFYMCFSKHAMDSFDILSEYWNRQFKILRKCYQKHFHFWTHVNDQGKGIHGKCLCEIIDSYHHKLDK